MSLAEYLIEKSNGHYSLLGGSLRNPINRTYENFSDLLKDLTYTCKVMAVELGEKDMTALRNSLNELKK